MHALLIATLLVLGQTDKADADEQLVDAWLKVSLDHAKAYHITSSPPARPLRLIPKPVFRHSQPVRGDDIGAVYLWLDASERPAVIGTTFAYTVRGDFRWVAHEMHSLADEPLKADWDGKTIWTPNRPGIAWQPIPKAPQPAKTSAQRMVQMRTLARRFRGQSTDDEGGDWQLRLLANPVYRYDQQNARTMLDGGVFLFCQGTDPEIVLLLEARKKDGEFQWQWACAAFSDYALRAELDGKEAWHSPKYPHLTNKNPHWINGQFRLTRLTESG
jgi:hypothetical protein